MLLNREQFLQVSGLKTERLSLPELGGEVLVREMMLGERERFLAKYRSDEEISAHSASMRTDVIVMCLVDEDGRRLLEPGDVPLLEQKSAAAMTRIFDVAVRLSGLGADAVADTQKNSASPADASSSDLQLL